MSAKMQNRVDNELQKVHSELDELADPFEYMVNGESRFAFHIREYARPFAALTSESKKPFVYVVGKNVYENASAMLEGELEDFERPAKVGWQFMINKRTQNNLSYLRNAHKKSKDGACTNSVASAPKTSGGASHTKTKSVAHEAPADVTSVVKAAAALVSAVTSLVASVEAVVQSRQTRHDNAQPISKAHDVVRTKEIVSAKSRRNAPRESRRASYGSDNDEENENPKNDGKQDRDSAVRNSKRVSFSKGHAPESESDDDREIFREGERYLNGSIPLNKDDDDDDDDDGDGDDDYEDVDENGNLVDPSFIASDGEEGTISEQESGECSESNDSDADNVDTRGRRSHGRSGKDGYDSDERRTREARERSKSTRPALLYGDSHQKPKPRAEAARPLHAYAKDGVNGHANRSSASDVRASAHGHRQQKAPGASRKRSPAEHDAMPPSKRPKANADDATNGSATTKTRTGRATSPNGGLSDMDPASLMDMIM
jgi:hypothetical protein